MLFKSKKMVKQKKNMEKKLKQFETFKESTFKCRKNFCRSTFSIVFHH